MPLFQGNTQDPRLIQQNKGIPPDPRMIQGNTPIANTPITNAYKLYNSGVGQNAEDYSGIMQGYKNLLASGGNNPTQTIANQQITPQQVTPQTYDYKPGADVTASIENLANLAKTGGYSPSDIADVRERGISPIRSVYANAQRNMSRNRSLSGGYSPNFNAATAKMSREMSEQLAKATTDINAGLAERIAQNKISTAGTYANTAKGASDTANQYGRLNTDTVNDANKFNATNVNEGNKFNAGNALETAKFNLASRTGTQSQMMDALRGMTSLYGTTPALANLFGNQALQGAQFQNQVTQQNKQPGYATIGNIIGGLR